MNLMVGTTEIGGGEADRAGVATKPRHVPLQVCHGSLPSGPPVARRSSTVWCDTARQL